MSNTINKLLLAGDKFMPEMHLRQPQFTYSACGPFTKYKQKELLQIKFKKIEHLILLKIQNMMGIKED